MTDGISEERPVSLKRRAVYAALQQDLSREQLEAALQAAEMQLVSADVPNLIRFVNRIAERFGINEPRRKELYIELYRLIHRTDPKQLPADPWQQVKVAVEEPPVWYEPQIRASKPAPKPEPSRPEHVVFNKLIEEIVAKLRDFGEEVDAEFQICLKSELAHLSGLPVASDRLWQWLVSDDRGQLPAMLDPEQLSDVLNTVYVAICHAIGPSKADRLLYRAVNRAEMLPEAVLFRPTQLL